MSTVTGVEQFEQTFKAPLASSLKLYAMVGFVAAFFAWSTIFQLDVASHSVGEVKPAGQTKPIQHLEGGIVREILVAEGQRVEAGDPLVALERVAAQTDLSTLKNQLLILQIKRARLLAQLDGREALDLPSELVQENRTMVQSEQQLLEAYQLKMRAINRNQLARIEQREAERAELQARLDHFLVKRGIVDDQIRINKNLRSKGLSNDLEKLALDKEKATIDGTIAETEFGMKRVDAAIRQETLALDRLVAEEEEKIQTELVEAESDLSDLNDAIVKAQDTSDRLVVSAPIAGTVLNLQVVTEGAVIAPGGTLLSIVPTGDELLIDLNLPVGDVGLVALNQPARVDLMSATARGYQPLEAKVVYVGADRLLDEQGAPFYRVRLKPATDEFVRGSTTFPLVPGVTVSATILTGKRSVFDYLFEPFTRLSRAALTEP
ncbi:MAG: HlyD family type I secretion periplasmic adaptor subunit [Gammaproteobacteria bacterium]|nr:HlyD family type I secretion periplasmic adaptor subunit [Gammaproteobacteria bacterium]